jgi:hypothetical protein
MRPFLFAILCKYQSEALTMITKAHIVDGALQMLAVEGLLLQAMADDQRIAIQHLDDMAAAYTALGLDGGYILPLEYGSSTASDDSGVDVGLAGPYKALLAAYIAQQYGKQVDPSKTDWAMKMLAAQAIESVGTTKYPVTLPMGSGNYDGPESDVYYRGGLPL